MSIPYYVHKEDKELYKQSKLEWNLHVELIKSLISRLELSGIPVRIAIDQAEEFYQDQANVLSKKYSVLRIKHIGRDTFDKTRYDVYFRGFCLEDDPEFRDKMVSVAENGIESCKKAIS